MAMAPHRASRLAAGLAVCALLGVTACGGKAASTAATGPLAGIKLANPGYLTVALIDGNLPSISTGTSTSLPGIDGAWITQTAKDLNLKIKTYPTTLSGQILAITSGKVDIGTSLHYTAERATQAYYTVPWEVSYTGIITKKSFSYSNADSLKGKTLGSETGLDYVPYMQKTYGTTNVKLYNSVAELNAALENGEIDAEVTGYDGYVNYIDKYPDFAWHYLKAGEMGMPQSIIATDSHNLVSCSNKPLATALGKTLASMQANGSWKQVLLKYNDQPDADHPAPLTLPQEKC